MIDHLAPPGSTWQEGRAESQPGCCRVFQTGMGIPISLSVIAVIVGCKAGLSMFYVGAPGHFMCKLAPDGTDAPVYYLDTFENTIMTRFVVDSQIVLVRVIMQSSRQCVPSFCSSCSSLSGCCCSARCSMLQAGGAAVAGDDGVAAGAAGRAAITCFGAVPHGPEPAEGATVSLNQLPGRKHTINSLSRHHDLVAPICHVWLSAAWV